ncbi:PepSY-associated TM helix domain-containing protein [Gimibacter soli]|uniref:PepSY-associated TM helix domain-containing protein n=1 Tax=Gimibacter soli TaxID=3024400 RepID=A0AAE9XTW9_9PROT|nr:PepSY-associated TM helix domain-containing protein [Gimibacter soli]WCL54350.1 PepSY-associated TM helix domain-containing protein [Gimibacter soli]
MPFRKLLYWPHLICGVLAGIVILTMSVTGVLLTYEKQMVAWSERQFDVVPPEGATALSPEELHAFASAVDPSRPVARLIYRNDPDAAVVAVRGRSDKLYLDPYTGRVIAEGPTAMQAFMQWTTQFHRWFALEGASRDTARMVTGAANLMFLFLALSGIYLWFPPVLRWVNVRKVLFFKKNANAHARDFNWHHVMGIWSVVPLVVITATATVFYYEWANNLVYRLAGEEVPVRGGRAPDKAPGTEAAALEGGVGLSAMLATASSHRQDWTSLTLAWPKPADPLVTFTLDWGMGGEPTKKGDLLIDRASGAVAGWAGFEDKTPASKARSMVRFLHTGEALGVIGQTIAGIVSLFSAIMVWTGIALAWRKYVTPLRRKRA